MGSNKEIDVRIFEQEETLNQSLNRFARFAEEYELNPMKAVSENKKQLNKRKIWHMKKKCHYILIVTVAWKKEVIKINNEIAIDRETEKKHTKKLKISISTLIFASMSIIGSIALIVASIIYLV